MKTAKEVEPRTRKNWRLLLGVEKMHVSRSYVRKLNYYDET